MFTNWGTWLGIENENGQVRQQQSVVAEHKSHETNKQTTAAESEQTTSAVKNDADSTQLIQKAKGFSGKCS